MCILYEDEMILSKRSLISICTSESESKVEMKRKKWVTQMLEKDVKSSGKLKRRPLRKLGQKSRPLSITQYNRYKCRKRRVSWCWLLAPLGGRDCALRGFWWSTDQWSGSFSERSPCWEWSQKPCTHTLVLIIIQFERFGITGGNFQSSPDRWITLQRFIITFYTRQYYAEETLKMFYFCSILFIVHFS